jgi:predicted transcriptional regulator
MLNRSANTATYDQDMAKIEITLPDDLLEKIDDAAHRVGETRVEFIRRVIESEVEESNARLRAQLEAWLDDHPLDLGGKTAAELIREGRDNR